MNHLRSLRPLAIPFVLALAAVGNAAQGTDRPLEVSERSTAAREPATSFEGEVLLPSGEPAAGATVVTSAGGRAVTDARGRFRLEVSVPASARGVHVTALSGGGSSGLLAQELVPLAGAGGSVRVRTLALQPGASCEPAWLPTFDGHPGVGPRIGGVSALVVFDDGSGPALYVAGNFESANSFPMTNVARWDGTTWSEVGGGVGPGTNESVFDLAIFDDGNGPALYAAGSFFSAGGTSAQRVARWDGASWSAVGSELSHAPVCLHVHDDGSGPQLYVGGSFTVPWSFIARWDGATWSDVGGGITGGGPLPLSVQDLATFDDGSGPALYAAGRFMNAGGNTVTNIARWDGSSWSGVGNGLTGDTVHALCVYDPGGGATLVAGGEITSASGLPVGSIAQWDGTSWSALGSGLDGDVFSLGVYDDGLGSPPVLVVGGLFLSAGGRPADRVATWDGTVWAALDGGGVQTDFGSCNVGAIAGFDDGRGPGNALYFGGNFLRAGGLDAGHVASYRGGVWSTLGGEDDVDDPVSCLAVHDEGDGPALYVAGEFEHVGETLVNRIARWDGAAWAALGSGFDLESATVHALASYDDGLGGGPALYAAGEFDAAGGVPAASIAKWDGATWAPLGTGVPGEIFALCVYDDGGAAGPQLYAGGQFASAGGTPVTRIARWNGIAWRPVGIGVGGGEMPGVHAMAVHDDGTGPALFVGGSFQMAGGSPASNVARWDGSSWSPLGAGVNGWVEALVGDGGGIHGAPALFSGGLFTHAGGSPATFVARWDGVGWSALGSGMDDAVFALAVHDDGGGTALFAGGDFSTAGGVASRYVARWDGSDWSSIGGDLDPGTYSYSRIVSDLEIYDAGGGADLFVGGVLDRSTAGDRHLARYGGCSAVEPGIGYCFGDGSGTPCPCGNAGAGGEGCANSSGAGAVLGASGTSSVAAADLVFTAHQLLPNQSALLFAGANATGGGDGLPFGDGLRCAGGAGGRFTIAVPSAQGSASWGPGLALGGGFQAGALWRFQVWYRDPAGSPCTSSFNLSNGYEVLFTP